MGTHKVLSPGHGSESCSLGSTRLRKDGVTKTKEVRECTWKVTSGRVGQLEGVGV